MRILLALATIAVAVSADVCRNNSYAPGAAWALAAQNLAGCADDGQCAVSAVFAVANNQTSPFWWNIYAAASDGKFVMIKNCRLQESTSNAFCMSSSTHFYVAYVKAADEMYRSVWALDEAGMIVGTGPIGTESNAYDPLQRPWYIQATTSGEGWTNVSTFASGGSGITYVLPVDVGVIAVDRTMRESCGPCLDNSVAVSSATTLATSRLNFVAGVNSAAGVDQVIMYIHKLVMRQQENRHSLIALYLGLSNNDFYMVQNCHLPETMNSANCMAANATGNQYLAYVRNTAVFSDDVRHIWALDENGVGSGEELTPSSTYLTTQRPWYLTQDGWADEYIFASNNKPGRTFTASFNGGVVGADYSYAEPCEACAPPPQNGQPPMPEPEKPMNEPMGPFNEPCKDHSYAVDAVMQLDNRASALEMCSTEQECVSEIFPVIQNLTSAYVWNVYFAKSDKSAYLIKNCRIAEAITAPFCFGATHWVAYVKNSTESYRRVYSLDSQGMLGEQIGTETNTYDPTARPWYILAMNSNSANWTGASPFAAGGQGYTFTQAIGSNGTVVAADRTSREPCGLCLTSSVSVSSVNALSSWWLRPFVGAETQMQIENNIMAIFDLFRHITGGPRRLLALYVGLPNSDFYMVQDCTLPETEAGAFCVAAAGAHYIALVRNTAVLGDTKRHGYSLDENGKTVEVGTPAEYPTTERTWYLTKNGWTDEYIFASTGAPGRTYTTSFFVDSMNTGVVAADYSAEEPCSGCAAPAPMGMSSTGMAPPPPPSGSESMMPPPPPSGSMSGLPPSGSAAAGTTSSTAPAGSAPNGSESGVINDGPAAMAVPSILALIVAFFFAL
jgi:hypothetical protein